jgi:hypothetical protein
MPWLAADYDMQQHHGIVACGGTPGLMLICDMQRHRSKLCEDPGRREGAAGPSVAGAGSAMRASNMTLQRFTHAAYQPAAG